jgi:hypothetical protein
MRLGKIAAVVLISLGYPGAARRAIAEDPRTEETHRIKIEAYGDVRYSHFDYGPDQKTGDHGSPPDNRAIVDLPILAAEFELHLDHDISIESEVEFEHGGTGAAMELAFEEFGEFEMEVEKGGEIKLEELHVTKSFNDLANLRAGHFITAVGLANWSHRPVDCFTVARAEAEVSVIPSTWDETGVELFGEFSNLHYRLQLVNGLDSSGFSSKFWIVGGQQGRFEDVKATENSRISSALDVPRTPVAKAAYAWYAELGYDVVSLFRKDATWKLYPFAHLGQCDTMAETDPSIFADPRFLRTMAIAGLNLFPSDEVVVKAEFSHRELGSDRFNNENTVSLDIGFSTDLFSK